MPHAHGSAAIVSKIAATIGVSPRTVLRLLSQETIDSRPTIRERAERVRSLAAKLGYRASTAARSARSGRLPLVALVQRAETDFMPYQLTRGLTEALSASQRELLVTRVPGEVVTDPTKGPLVLREVLATGLVIHQAWDISDAVRSAVAELGIPAVWVNTRGGGDCVYPDELSGTGQLTEELLRLGHRRIAWFDCHLKWSDGGPDHYSWRDRQRGHADAMVRAGLRVRTHERVYHAAARTGPDRVGLIARPDIMSPWGTEADDRIAFASELLRAHGPPTAVVCSGADSAGPLIVAAREMGLRVPQDLSVCCIDTEIFSHCGHRPTTGIIPFRECGHAAIARLDELLAGRRPRQAVSIPYTTFEGSTIAAAPA
jgi:DNA-binding LacI/PurR family transcriptional regulator